VIGRVRLPESHLGNPVGLGNDPLSETKRLEGLHAACLDAVGLAYRKPAQAPLNDARSDTRELGQLCRGEHAGGAGANNQHVNFVGKPGWSIKTNAGCRLDSGVTGYVTVVVELHGLSSLLRGLVLHGCSGCVR
jgi:hypothetical protein